MSEVLYYYKKSQRFERSMVEIEGKPVTMRDVLVGKKYEVHQKAGVLTRITVEHAASMGCRQAIELLEKRTKPAAKKEEPKKAEPKKAAEPKEEAKEEAKKEEVKEEKPTPPPPKRQLSRKKAKRSR